MPTFSFEEALDTNQPSQGFSFEEATGQVEHPNLGDQTTEVPLLTKIGAKAYDIIGGPLYGLSRMFPTTAIPDALQGLSQGIAKVRGEPEPPYDPWKEIIQAPMISPETMQKGVEFMTPGGRQPEGSVGLGVQQFLGDLASGLTSQEAIGTMAMGKVSPKIPAFGFGVPMAQGVGPEVEKAVTAETTPEQVRHGLGALLGTVGPIGLARGAMEGPKPSGLTRSDYPNFGRVSDKEQLVRESQGPIPIIGGEPPLPRVRSFTFEEGGGVEPVSQATKAPVEPSGGEISFRSEAAAKAIPSARQSAQEHPTIGEQDAIRIRRNERSVQEEGLLGQGREDIGGENIQRPQEEGTRTSEPIQRQGGEGEVKLPQWIREEMQNRGLDPNRPFNDIDIQNPSVREAIQNDPSLTTEQKSQLLNKGSYTKPPTTPLYSIQGLMFDPEFYRRTGRGIKDVAGAMGEYLKGAKEQILPNLRFDTASSLPDLQDKPLANKIASQPFASEKVPILGRAMGGKARIRTPQDEAVAAWHHEYYGVAKAVAGFNGELVRGKIDKVLRADEEGNLNVRPTREGQSLKVSDVIEGLQRDPNSYVLSPIQRQVFDRVITPIVTRQRQLANKYGITDELSNGYLTRVVTKRPGEEGPRGRGGKPLARQFIEKERAFKEEREGWERGYKYSPSIEQRLTVGTEKLYKAIANKRLVNDPVLGARTVGQIKAELMESYAPELASGEMTEANVERILDSIKSKGTVMQPQLMGKIFDKETAQMLNKEFAAEESSIRKGLVKTNSFLKAAQLGFDFGVGQIQLLPTLYNNPRVWAQAQWEGLKGFTSPKFFSQYVEKNKQYVNELAQMGSGIGRLPEMLQGVEKGELISRIPGVGQAAQAFGRQFQGALDVAKVEMWKALRDVSPKSEWPKVVQAIEGMLLTSRMESSMIGKGRALTENVFLLAPSYYRGALNNLVASLVEKGVGGKESRKALAKFVGGSVLTYYAVAKSLGMQDDEIKKRLNPAATEFMTWQVKQEDGRIVNFGFGGIHRSLLRLMGRVATAPAEDWKKPSTNPLARWYRGHAGPTVSIGWEALTEKDFLGRESDLSSLGPRTLPLTLQNLPAFQKEGEVPTTPIEYGAGLLGMNAMPENYTSRRSRMMGEKAQEEYKVPFEKLPISERRDVTKQVNERLQGEPTGMTEKRSREIALIKEDERKKQLLKDIDQGAVKWAKENKVKIPNYETTVERRGVTIGLTPDERTKLHKAIVQEYNEVFKEAISYPDDWKDMTADQKQRVIGRRLEGARRRAMRSVISSMGE